MGALSGIRVLDLTHVLNGPFCTVLLAHMGADVLKLEYGDGDRFRHAWMPADSNRDGYEFLHVNSNKRGLALDLKQEKGKALLRELIVKSDVLVENFATGVLERLGFGYEGLCKINPRLIYACSRGYGENGPYKDIRANAATIGAITGWAHNAMHLAQKPGIRAPGIADETAGASLCIGIISALYSREKTGKGQKVSVSMQEALLGFMTSTLHSHFERREVSGPPKPCADGYYSFHVPDMTDSHWRTLATAFDRPGLVDDPRFCTKQNRRINYLALEDEISQMVRSHSRSELWNVLSELGLSSAPVLSIAEALQDPHLKECGLVEIGRPEAGRVTMIAPWIHFSDTPSAISTPAPAVGEHTREILSEILGLEDIELDALERDKVIIQKRASSAPANPHGK
jgi:crotonobetainyl-CoA:carnitine CoA-transferase CaiB-like acyl-CoA transferase